MRLGSGTADFDTSETALASDSLNTILAVAVEVMMECAPDPGNTRLERMARYIVRTLGVYDPAAFTNGLTILGGGVALAVNQADEILLQYRYNDMPLPPKMFNVDAARVVAAALLTAADYVEEP